MKGSTKDILKKIGIVASFVVSTIVLLGIAFFAAIGLCCIQLYNEGVIAFI